MMVHYVRLCFRLHAVLHRLDWLCALANLWEILTEKHVETSSLEDRKTILTNIWDYFKYLIALTKALLETALSVAASVILSLLLISGDVERNPGPGRYPGKYSALRLQ